MTKDQKKIKTACDIAGGVQSLADMLDCSKRTVYDYLAGTHKPSKQVYKILFLMYGEI